MAQLLAAAIRALPLLAVAAVVGIVLFGSSTVDRRAESIAEFLDRDADGRVIAAAFADVCPEAEILRGLPSLKRLQLHDIALEADTLQQLATMEELASVSLDGCTFQDGELLLLNELSGLQYLNLSRTSVRSADFHKLKLPGLMTFKLNDCDWVDNSTLRSLKAFSALQSLELNGAAITDDGIKHLVDLRELNWLMLHDCELLTDQTLEHLAEFESLWNVRLPGTNLSLAAAHRLRQHNPSVQLLARLSEFNELQPFFRRSSQLGGTPVDATYFEGLSSLSLHDEEGLNYGPLLHVPGFARLHLLGAAVGDDAMQRVAEITALTSLDVAESGVTDRGVEFLASLKNLESLNLAGTKITDKSIEKLAAFSNLRRLDISRTAVSDDGLELLHQLPALQILSALGLDMGDKGLEQIASLQCMMPGTHVSGFGIALDLSASHVTAKGLAFLKDAPITWAKLNNLAVTDGDLAVVGTWPRLQHLDLSGTQVTGAGLNFESNSELRSLLLAQTNVSDETLPLIRLPPSLSNLSLSGTTVTGATLPELSGAGLYWLDVSGTPLNADGITNAFELRTLTLILPGVPLHARQSLNLSGLAEGASISLDADSPILDILTEEPLAPKLGWLTLHEATAKQLDAVRKISTLTSLQLIDGAFGSDSFLKLSGHPSLTNISLRHCQLAPEAIQELGMVRNLSSVTIEAESDQALTDAFDELQITRPDIRINFVNNSWAAW
ncbi:hypothetical protein [Fuerstiella marisgermanici]|uniref:Ran GTPase-activating protein (RanGAP) involved in mRNA processing and transport n=1 Tax=Fuerstiella marisgermanici TaxID=1891926 RepID=A0A1P8WNS1_9PLAN|nr:hypothetical protein [Fuerstiella marisgermanici]APZ95695.1 Ran GTPase-activating protein (RanGAP) involved in mRNA processing and transport [Fuerstiella marisgermanici]